MMQRMTPSLPLFAFFCRVIALGAQTSNQAMQRTAPRSDA